MRDWVARASAAGHDQQSAAGGARGVCARFLVVGFVALATAGYTLAQEQKRVALIVGNSKYPAAGDLKNPVEDASSMQVALYRLNFNLIVGHDLTASGFRDKVSEFTKAITGADIALFFFAGHGVQYDGRNYLLPSDIKLKSRADVVERSILLDKVLSDMGRSAKASVTFLDACRDSPEWRGRSPPKESQGVWRFLTGGFARVSVDDTHNHFIGFAAATGKTALDGAGRNSPFTAALVRHIAMPDADIATMFTFVRRDVLKETNSRQQPEALSKLAYPVLLNPKQSGGQPAPVFPRVTPSPDADASSDELLVESNHWIGIMDSTDPTDFEEYLEEYPQGRYARLARQRIERLKASAKPSEPRPPDAHLPEGIVTGAARIGKDLSKDEARRGALALARAKAILAKVPLPQATLPNFVRSSNEAAELLGYMIRGFSYGEEWKWQEAGKDVGVELRAKVRPLRPERERRLSGAIEPPDIVSGKTFRVRIDAKKAAGIGVYVWQADDTMVRFYPDKTLKPVNLKAKETVWFPREGDPYPAFGAANLRGAKRNHEALIVVTGAGGIPFEKLVPTVVSEVPQSASENLVEVHTFLNRLAEIADPELELLVLPYEVRAGP
jgi:hypothetical protein